MDSNQILGLFLIFVGLETLFEAMLLSLNLQRASAGFQELSPTLQEAFDEDTREKSKEYTLAKGRYALVSQFFSSALIVVIVLSGFLGWADGWVQSWQLPPLLESVAVVLTLIVASTVVSLPFGYYETFVLESRFGFNRSTLKLWIVDLLKQLALSVLIYSPLLYGVFWFVREFSEWWWLYAALLIVIVQIVLIYLYPVLIAPWFNKFNPLPEGDLREGIEQLCEKLNFRVAGVFVMDGSRRSSHSNAYFTGFGRFRRVVLYDTLVESLSVDELLAVLAHEIGHEKLGHVKIHLLISIVGMILGFWLLSLVLGYESLPVAVGFDRAVIHTSMISLALVLGPFLYFASPLFSALSRTFEYQADRFAVRAVESWKGLAGALISLSRNNLSNLSPHPWFSAFHYSHPTLSERVDAMERTR